MSTEPEPDGVPPSGSFVVDLKTERVAEVMEYRTGHLYLRQPGGGPEWVRTPEQVRATDAMETLRARVARLNAEDWRGAA